MSSSAKDLLRRTNDPGYINWLAVGNALMLLGDGLRKYAEIKMKELHALITTNVGGPGVKCHCKYTPGMKSNPHGPKTRCVWAIELKKFQVFGRKRDLFWHQSTSSQWDDPNLGYWEIAKLFMSDLGKDRAKTKDPSTTDIGPLLNLLINCNHFNIQRVLLDSTKDWRNKCAHAPGRTFSDMDRQAAFKDIESLMNDPELMSNKDVQDCRPAIKRVEKADVAILQDNELKILQEYRRIQEFEERKMTEKLEQAVDKLVEVTDNLTDKIPHEISNKSTAKITDKVTAKITDKVTAKIMDKVTAKITDKVTEKVYIFLTGLLFQISFLCKVPGVVWYLVAYFTFSQVGDRSVILDEGCPAAMIKSPISHFNYQEFDFSSYLAYKREGFIGRKWFFLEMESIFEESPEIAGVLITGEPGSGKSALMSQLICSPFSSLLIHDNTIGYHLCEYSENGKRDGARFVRNLVDQIATRLPEYAEHVINNEQLRKELDERCQKDSIACFFTTIVGPLRKIKQPDDFRFIIIDALDECFESDMKTSEIMDILKNKIIHFPKWLKVVLTSRNLTSVTSKLPLMINRTSLYATDERNVKDIRYYVSRFISQNSYFSDRQFLDEVITRAEGNFLFVKTTIQYMNDTKGKIDFHSSSTSLFDLYSIFFNRQFGEDGFGPFKSLFEVLLAVYSPLQSQDIEEILKSDYEAADISKLFERVSCFLRFGRDGTVRIYHQSFAEWLKDQSHALCINKTRGHQSIAKFLLRRIRKRYANVTFEDLTELFIHILTGKAFEMQETAVNLFNVTEMREPETNQSILHYLVTKPSIYVPVLDFFLQKFQTVDVLDANNKTPAFYAASEGFVQSLQSCINNGADVSSFLEGYTELDPFSIVVRNTGIEEFSLMHQAVAKGHTDLVELFLKSNVSFPDYSKNYPTPLHLAAGNGHLEVVKLFHNYGSTFDQITLHHAAARHHLPVVQFLLSTVGLRDTCAPCESNNLTQLSINTTVREVHSYFCETALHAAVSRGLIDIVNVLLPSGKEALECKHHSGKTVLMDAVERNDTEMVDLLLEHGVNVTNDCGWRISDGSNKQICSLYSTYKQDFLYTVYCGNDSCDCGNRAVHVSAKYGLWNMAEKLTTGRIREIIDLVNCDKDSATHLAVIYDHIEFVRNANISLNKIGRLLVESKVFKAAILYCSASAAEPFVKYKVNHEDVNVWGLSRQTVRWSPCNQLETTMASAADCLKAFQHCSLSEEEKAQKQSERRLNILKLLTEIYQEISLFLNKKNDNGMTLLHYAALYGFEDAVKYLVKLGADTLLTDNDGDTPLMIAVKESPSNDLNPNASYRCYTTDDGQFSSCNTTCYDETVRFLIQSQKSNISKCDGESAFMLKEVLVKRLPLSLYALLKTGVDLNCKFNDFSSAWLLYLYEGGAEVSEVLKMFEVDVSPKCEIPSVDSELHLISYLSGSDDFGNFFKPSLNKKRFPLQRLIDRHPRGVRILDECYDAEGYLPIHRAAQGGNIAAIKWFKNIGVNTQLKSRDGLTALGIATWNLKDKNATTHLLERFVINPRCRGETFEELLRAFFDTSLKNYSSDISSHISFSQKPILHLPTQYGLDVLTEVYNKALEIIPALKKNQFLLLDEQDVNGETALHIAAYFGLEDVVKYLIRLGADINIKNKKGGTPLLIALIKSPDNSTKRSQDRRCYTTNDGFFTSCETTPHDEIGKSLILSQKSSISKCDAKSVELLNLVIEKRMPLSLYALLKEGVDVNCKGNESLSPFLLRILLRGQQISEVFKIFEVDVFLECGVPFMTSELHLISYVSVSSDFGNFFKPSINRKRSPLQRLIDRHPRGVRILDECYDAEGYLPIHRAAQGGNLAAIKWFKRVGVKTYRRTRSVETSLKSGSNYLTALDITILYLKDNHHARILSSFSCAFVTRTSYRSESFKLLLQTFSNISYENNSSNVSSTIFSKHRILHFAAKIGIDVLKDVYKRTLKILPALKKKKILILNEQDANGQTPLHIAAQNGLDDVVKYLVRLGANINIKDKDGNTPLFAALQFPTCMAVLNLNHRCYTTNDGIFTSCNTTSHDEIVRFLIWSQKSTISRCDAQSAYLLNQVVVEQMPLALYALLKVGVDINCKQNQLMSPLLQHLRTGSQHVSEVLKIFEVDVSVECGVPFMQSELHLISYISVSGDFGNFFKPYQHKKRSPIQRLTDRHPRGFHILDECYDAEGYLPIHRAAQGGNVDAIKWFKSIGVKTQRKTRSVKTSLKTRGDHLTALDISILYLKDNHHARQLSSFSGAFVTSTSYRSESFKLLLQTFFNISLKKYSSNSPSTMFPRHRILHLAAEIGLDVLKDVYKKALKILPGLKRKKFLILNEQDADGQTPLHIAAKNGLDDVVKYLVRLGANINIKDKDGNTPLFAALKFPSTYILVLRLDHRCYTTNDGLFTSCNTTSYDEIVRFLIWSQKSTISKCEAQSAYFLNQVVVRQMPLSLYTLLKIGVDINCKENQLMSPLLQHLRTGGQHVSEVLKIFEVDVSFECGVPFTESELHLISYISGSRDFGNFFKPSLNKKRFPVQRLIDRHPRGVRILDECYDAEGYLPIHRAAQGGNLDAIKWFKNIGLNTQLTTRRGLTALDLSILYLGYNNNAELIAPLGSYKCASKLYLSLVVPVASPKDRKLMFKELLQGFLDTLPQLRLNILCGPALEGLSPLHIAAVKGITILRYVHKIASEIIPNLPINCINKHRIDSVYLGEFYTSALNEGLVDKNYNDTKKNIRMRMVGKEIHFHIKKTNQNNVDEEFSDGRVPTAQYPNQEVDYIMAFNYLYHPPPSNLPHRAEDLLNNAEDILYLLKMHVSDCPAFRDSSPKLKETVPLNIFLTVCSQIEEIIKKLLLWKQRRNRQLSPFIIQRLGWSDSFQNNNIDDRWPLEFLHRKLKKKYEAYEYLKILNEALEIADVRFCSQLLIDAP